MPQSSWQPPVAFADDGSEVVPSKRTGSSNKIFSRSNSNQSTSSSNESRKSTSSRSWKTPFGSNMYVPPAELSGSSSDEDIQPLEPRSYQPSTSSNSSYASDPQSNNNKEHKRAKSPMNLLSGNNWMNKLFVVNEGDDADTGHDSSNHHPSAVTRTLTMLRPKALARKSTIITDPTLLRTRLEWNQELVGTAFRPYKLLLAHEDKDLPHTEEDLTHLEADMEQELLRDEHIQQCREEMLKDASITEREIAAFFEGLKLYALKANSLKSQLDGAHSRERFRSQSILMRTVSTRSKSQALFGNDEALATDEDDCDDDDSFAPSLYPLRSSMPPRSATVSEGAEMELPSITKFQSSAPARMESYAPKRALSTSLRQLSLLKVKESSDTAGDERVQKLLKELEEAEARQKKLEKQLQQAGVQIAEDIPYEEAKEKVHVIAERMNEIGGSQSEDPKLREEYFKLEQEMEKYTSALMLTDEWAKEQEEIEREWEASCEADNANALQKLRRCMPVNVRNLTESELVSEPSPNGKHIPPPMAKKFKRTNILQILRMNPDDIVRMHPSTLENMRVTGLTLTERRALYAHLKAVGPKWEAKKTDQMFERKWNWFNMMKGNFKEALGAYQRHVEQYGPSAHHQYASRENPGSGCPLIGNQCPIKADQSMNYDDDFGYPEGDEYFRSDVKKTEVDDVDKAKREALEALREKKALARSDALKQHYQGNVLQITLANGSAEAMDEAMDEIENFHEKWIKCQMQVQGEITEYDKKREVSMIVDTLHELKLSTLHFAERSGMQLTGKRDANRDHPDNRSMIELCLCDEFIEAMEDLFTSITERVDTVGLSDGRMLSTVNQLYSLVDELKERNHKSIENLAQERPHRSRKMKSHAEIRKVALSKGVEEAPPPAENQVSRPLPVLGGKEDMLKAIAERGKKKAKGGESKGEGGPPSFLAAIAARGPVE